MPEEALLPEEAQLLTDDWEETPEAQLFRGVSFLSSDFPEDAPGTSPCAGICCTVPWSISALCSLKWRFLSWNVSVMFSVVLEKSFQNRGNASFSRGTSKVRCFLMKQISCRLFNCLSRICFVVSSLSKTSTERDRSPVIMSKDFQ